MVCWLLPSLRRILLPLLRFIREVSSSSLPRRGIPLGTCVQKNQERVPQKAGTGKPLINACADTWATGQKDDLFSLSAEGNRGGNTRTSTPFERASYYVKSLSRTLGAYTFLWWLLGTSVRKSDGFALDCFLFLGAMAFTDERRQEHFSCLPVACRAYAVHLLIRRKLTGRCFQA